MSEVELKGISSAAEIFKSKNGYDVVFGEFHYVSPEEALKELEEDIAVAKTVISKNVVQMSDGRINEKYVLLFEKDILNNIEEGFVVINLIDRQILYWSKSVNLEALEEFENF